MYTVLSLYESVDVQKKPDTFLTTFCTNDTSFLMNLAQANSIIFSTETYKTLWKY